MRANGEPYLNHPLWVAYILTQLYADEAAIAAALLHDTIEDTWATPEDIEENFGPTIARLVDGVTKLSKLQYTSKAQRQAESYRKMFLAMAEDLRVILVKLADRLHNIRTLEYLADAKRQTIAQETMDLYAPLAGRLGIQWIRSELEDMSFRYLEPEAYAVLAKSVDERRVASEASIRDVIDTLQTALAEAEIAADVTGRQKNLYSIHKKMQERGVELDQIYDATAFRVMVDSVADCYAVIGLVHGRWTPIPGRFKDYIALPKANKYQSLHTTVIGPEGKPIEIQIRTYDMHRIAELGVAAHWSYKDGEERNRKHRESFEWLRQLYSWHSELKDSEQFVEAVRVDLFKDEVYVFTPEGDVINLPADATPLDFAYKIHTEIGHKTSGAKVNGRIVPLHTALENGNIVEILTTPSSEPRRDWLRFAKTSAARQRIRAYLNRKDREQALMLGESLLNQAFKEAGGSQSQDQWLASVAGKRILKELKLADRAQLVEALGYGRIALARVKELLTPPEAEKTTTWRFGGLERLLRRGSTAAPHSPLLVDGLDGVQTSVANCCKPLPGDPVVGYIRAGKGIKIHAKSCPQLLDANPERIVPVSWGATTNEEVQVVQLDIECIDSPGALGKIGQAISSQKVNIVEITFRSRGDGKAEGVVSISVHNRKELDKVLVDLGKIKGILSVRRR